MDTGFTYVTKSWERVSVYAPPGLQPPDVIEMTGRGGELVEAVRLSDRSLVCEDGVVREHDRKKNLMMDRLVKCKDPFECHKHVIGQCACGIHPTENGRRLPVARA
jgi:hypothetical protein